MLRRRLRTLLPLLAALVSGCATVAAPTYQAPQEDPLSGQVGRYLEEREARGYGPDAVMPPSDDYCFSPSATGAFTSGPSRGSGGQTDDAARRYHEQTNEMLENARAAADPDAAERLKSEALAREGALDAYLKARAVFNGSRVLADVKCERCTRQLSLMDSFSRWLVYAYPCVQRLRAVEQGRLDGMLAVKAVLAARVGADEARYPKFESRRVGEFCVGNCLLPMSDLSRKASSYLPECVTACGLKDVLPDVGLLMSLDDLSDFAARAKAVLRNKGEWQPSPEEREWAAEFEKRTKGGAARSPKEEDRYSRIVYRMKRFDTAYELFAGHPRSRPEPPRPQPPAAPAAVPAKSRGKSVKVEWKGSWWDAEIKSRRGGKTCVHYVGWDDSWDECVGPERIRRQ